MGKILLVSGFFLAIYALAESSKSLIHLSLILLAMGITFMLINFFATLISRGPDKGPSAWMGSDRGDRDIK